MVKDHNNKKVEENQYRVVKVKDLEKFLNKNPDWKPKQSVNSEKFLIERIG
jgi:hypothetical protein